MSPDPKFPLNPPGTPLDLRSGNEDDAERDFPHAFRLNRLREIPLIGEDFIEMPSAKSGERFPERTAWRTAFGAAPADEAPNSCAVSARSALQALFEREYGVPQAAVLRPTDMQTAAIRDLIKSGILLFSGNPPPAAAPGFFVNLPALGFVPDKPIAKAVILRRKKTGRAYLCLDEDGRSVLPDSYTDIGNSPEIYLSFWRSVHSLVLVADSAAAAKVLGTEASYVSNEAGAIFDEVSEILPKYEIAYRLIKGFREQLKAPETVRIGDSGATRTVMANFAQVYEEYVQLRGRLGELRERAASHNWILLVDDLSEKLPDDKERVISIGLYTDALTTYSWKVEVTINESSQSKNHSSSHYEHYYQGKSAKVVAYEAAGRPVESYSAAVDAMIRETVPDGNGRGHPRRRLGEVLQAVCCRDRRCWRRWILLSRRASTGGNTRVRRPFRGLPQTADCRAAGIRRCAGDPWR